MANLARRMRGIADAETRYVRLATANQLTDVPRSQRRAPEQGFPANVISRRILVAVPIFARRFFDGERAATLFSNRSNVVSKLDGGSIAIVPKTSMRDFLRTVA